MQVLRYTWSSKNNDGPVTASKQSEIHYRETDPVPSAQGLIDKWNADPEISSFNGLQYALMSVDYQGPVKEKVGPLPFGSALGIFTDRASLDEARQKHINPK